MLSRSRPARGSIYRFLIILREIVGHGATSFLGRADLQPEDQGATIAVAPSAQADSAQQTAYRTPLPTLRKAAEQAFRVCGFYVPEIAVR